MGYEKKDWQRSDGKLRTAGKESREKEKRLKAYHPSDKENTKEKRPNEMMTMESSYGGISFGSSRERKMTMVVHEKRSVNGPGLKKDNHEVEGNSAVALGEKKKGFRTNNHSREDSALAYTESLEMSPLRMMERIQKTVEHHSQKAGEQVLPFLEQEKEKRSSEEIRDGLRESLEKQDGELYQFWSRKQEHFLREKTEKEQMRKAFYKELTFAREKSKRLMKEDVPLLTEFKELLENVAETQEEPSSEEVNLSKEHKKESFDYKNV